jgi:hypothetical protein
MGTSYPGSVETFNEPSLPEETVLSSAGSASRNHTEHHADLGDTVEALQIHAAQKQHDHSGDSADATKGGKLLQANTHEGADTDTGPSAIHHSLGLGANQAAAGNHTHDYYGASILNVPMNICTSTTRPEPPTAGMMIYETDTKCFRHWEQYANNVVAPGLDCLIDFNTFVASGLPDGFTVNYLHSPTTHGRMQCLDGHWRWQDDGNNTNVGWGRRTDPATQVTLSDDQVFTWMTTDIVTQSEGLLFDEGATHDYYFRVSSDEQSYTRLRVGDDYLKVFYTTTGRDNEKHLGTFDDLDINHPNQFWRAQFVGRMMQLFQNGRFIGSIPDDKNVTAKGVNNRGWMIGMQAGQQLAGQTTPGEIDWVRMQDYARYESVSRWSLLNIGARPKVRLRQGKKQRILPTGTVVEFSIEDEDTFGFFDKTVSQTEVVIGEAGDYDFNAALQWDSQGVPDIASAVILINGLETELRDQSFMRGNSFTPGFSQTLRVSGWLPLAVGDRVSLKASYTARSGLDEVFTFLDAASKIDTRLSLRFAGPG